jgi:amino acid adenylation domain-containing protein
MNILQDYPTGIPEEQIKIRAQCFHPSGSFEEFEKQDIEQSITERFEQQVKKCPDRLAIKTQNYKLTYGMLNNLANRIAHGILEQRGEGQEPVALLLELDAPLIAAILGVMKAGKYYVPLDQSYPNERLSYMLEDAKAGLLVTSTKGLSAAHRLTKHTCQLLEIDLLDDSISQDNPGLYLAPDTNSYIIYTSGSTGQPKGVMQNHRNVLHKIMVYTNYIHICAEDRLTLLTSAGSSSSVWHIFGAICNGSSLYPFDLNSENISSLRSWLKNEAITVYNSVPALFRCVFNSLAIEDQFSSLRVIFLGGDAALMKDSDLYKAYCSDDCFLVNSFGTTETGSICYYIIEKKTNITDNILPVGYPIQDKEILLFDDKGNRIDGNEVGEIAIKSQFLSPGYWRKPDLTYSKFSPDPDCVNASIYRTGDLGRIRSDGCLINLGRKDFQVKVRGFRIELGDIEATLEQYPAVWQAVVTAREDIPSDKQLVAYIVAKDHQTIPVNKLRNFLKKKLPAYMVPSLFEMIDTLPLTPNGKIDRRALPAPDRARSQPVETLVAPRDELELQLTKTWEKILGVQPIGVHDNFFELGGHSLLALSLVTQIEKILGKNLPIATLFQAPTVEQLSSILREQGWSAPSSSLEAIEVGGAGSRGMMRMKHKIADYIPRKSHAHLKQQYYKIKKQPGYLYLKRQYFRAKSSITRRFLSYSPVQLEEKLREIGLTEADTVYMHSAFNAFNGFSGGPHQIIDCILNVIGGSGNLLMVSMPYTGSTDDYLNENKTFDVIKTESSMGIITEIFRRKKDVVRSLNPAHPILAFGPNAKWITSDHDKTMYSCGKGSPFEKITKLNAKAFFFDVPFTAMTLFHYLEDKFKDSSPVKLYDDEPIESTVIDSNGNEIRVKTYVFTKRARENRSARLIERELKKKNLMKTDRVGNTKLALVNLKDVVGCAQELVNAGLHFYK